MTTVRMVVVDESGHPLIGVTVAAYSLTNFPSILAYGVTDAAGSARITTDGPAFYDAFDRRGVSFRDRSYAGKVQIQIISFGNAPCYDYVVDADGNGTHLTVRAMMADFLVEAAAASGVTRACWLCSDDTDKNIEFGSSNGNVSGATLSIEGAGSVHESNANSATPRHILTAGATLAADDAYFKTALPKKPRIVFRNIRLVSRHSSDSINNAFITALLTGGGSDRIMAHFYDCDLLIGYTTSTKGVLADGTNAGSGNGAELYLNNCTGSVGGLLRFSAGFAAGNIAAEDCRLTMYAVGSDLTTGTMSSITFRGGAIATTGYLINNTSGGGKTFLLQGTTFRHTGSSVWFQFTSGQIDSGLDIYMDGLSYSQSSTTLGAVTIAAPSFGSGHRVFIDASSFTSDSANTATAIVVTGSNFLSAQSGILAAPNFAAIVSGMTTTLTNLTVSGTFTATIAHSSLTSLVAPADDHTQYALLAGRGSPVGNAFVGYASWGTSATATGYTSAVTGIAGLQSYWRLGEAAGPTATDNQALQNGTYTGGVTYSQPSLITGDANTSVVLNGTTGYVACTNNAAFQIATGTITAWIKTIQTGTFKGIITKQQAYGMYLNNGTLVAYDFGGAALRDSGVVINDGVRHFVALVFGVGAGASQLYVDGVAAGAAFASAVNNQTVQLLVGYGNAGGQFFSGTIDEPNIYNVALTPANIAALYAAGTGGAPAPVNTTNGDITGLRLNIGNVVFAAGVEAQITGDSTFSGYLRVGSNTVPTNVTAGDLTVVRLNIGDVAFATGAEFQLQGDGAISGFLGIGSASVPLNTTAGDLTAKRLELGTAAGLSSAEVLKVTFANAATTGGIFQLNYTHSPAVGNTGILFSATHTVTPTADASGGVETAFVTIVTHGTGAFNTGTLSGFKTTAAKGVGLAGVTDALLGVQAIATNRSTVTKMAAVIATINFNSGGVATNLYSYEAVENSVATASGTNRIHFGITNSFYEGVYTNVYGLSVPNLGQAGVTNAVGIDLAAQSGAATLNFGIRNAGNSVQTGYARFGAVTAPTNVADGDLTVARLFIPNVALASESRLFQLTDTWTPIGGAFHSLGVGAVIDPGAGVAADEYRTATFDMTVIPTAAFAGTARAFNARFTHDSGVFDVASGAGFFGQVSQNVAATTLAVGRGGHLVYRAIAGTITAAIGLQIEKGIAGDAGAIGTGTGLFIGASAGVTPTTDITIRALGAGAHMRHQGSVVIGADASPAAATVGLYLTQLMAQSGANISVGVDGSAPRIILAAMDGTNEGGELVLNGAAANADWTLDNNAGSLRWFTGGTVYAQLGTAGFMHRGYLNVAAAVAAPTNTTAGDVTMLRLNVGNVAFGTGVDAQIQGDAAISGWAVIGSAAAPLNTTAGDITGARLMVGTDTSLTSGPLAMIKQPTIGNEVLRLESVSTDNARISWFQGRVATTDATFTTLITIAIPADQTVQVTCKAQGRRTGGTSGTAGDSGCYEDRAAFKNIGGVVTQIGTTQHTFDLEDQAAWDTDFVVSGTNVLYQVKGATNNNVTWHGHCVASGYV